MIMFRELLFCIALVGTTCAHSSTKNQIGNQHYDDDTLKEILITHDDLTSHDARRIPHLRHDLPVPAMIAREGYPVETHTIITEDCYILEMHRIPHGKNEVTADVHSTRPVVLLQHGLLCSSADWVMGSDYNSLGFILADAGYDVWLGNYRGNTYSRAHCTLQPSDKAFWKFSWDEMGKYDIPAMMDKIFENTNQDKIFYIGHSMGTTAFMAMANVRPEYQDHVALATFLSPVAYVDHMKSPIHYIAGFAGSIEWIANFLGLGEFLPSNFLMDILANLFCDEGILQGICSSVLFVLCGFDEAQLNRTMLETITHHTPAGASTNTIIHYGQEVNSGRFQHYDHGKADNLVIYGQENPPKYHIDALTVPVAAFWSLNDWLADGADVLRFFSEVPNGLIVDNYQVPFAEWNHLDYLWGIDAHTLVYPQVLKNMDKVRQNMYPDTSLSRPHQSNMK